MTFPASETVYIWRMNDTDYAYGVFDFAEGNSLDRFASVSEFTGTLVQTISHVKEQYPTFEALIATDAGMLARIDQFAAEIRNTILEEDLSNPNTSSF